MNATTTPEPATENELIEVVKKWVAEDEEFDLSERMPCEEMVERLQECIDYRPPESPISKERVEEIVRTYAPNAPHRSTDDSTIEHRAPELPISERREIVTLPSATPAPVSGQQDYPPPAELEHLKFTKFDNDCWYVKRCKICGEFDSEQCCGQETELARATQPDSYKKVSVLSDCGRQAAGLIPIRKPKPPEPPKSVEERWKDSEWWKSFKGASELENGGIKMYIENFLPEGIVLICGLPKEGKSWLALSIAKALTSGKPMFGNPKFGVPETIPVLYLAAEVSDRAFKQRLTKFGITEDKTKFLCRTLSSGPRLGLYHADIETVVRQMKPVIILDTVIRFNDGSDEDSATENQKLADAIFYLRGIGARAVVGIHHSRKDLKDGEPTMEKAVRGSGDLAAMTDCVWGVVRDERLYRNNTGPNELKVIGWGRDFNPEPFRLALTRRAPKDLPNSVVTFAPGVTSCIDETGDLGWVDKPSRPDQSGLSDSEPESREPELIERVRTEIERAYSERRRLNQAQLAQLVGVTTNRAKSKLLNGGPDKPWRCVTDGGRAVFFIPKDAPGLPGKAA